MDIRLKLKEETTKNTKTRKGVLTHPTRHRLLAYSRRPAKRVSVSFESFVIFEVKILFIT